MAHQNRLFDIEFPERRMQHLRLHLDGDGLVIGTITVTMTRAIESKPAVVFRDWPIQLRPILTRTRIAVNQTDRPARAFDHKVYTGFVHRNEF